MMIMMMIMIDDDDNNNVIFQCDIEKDLNISIELI